MKKPAIQESCKQSFYVRDRWIDVLQGKKKLSRQERYTLRHLLCHQAGGREGLRQVWLPRRALQPDFNRYALLSPDQLPRLHKVVHWLEHYAFRNDAGLLLDMKEPEDKDPDEMTDQDILEKEEYREEGAFGAEDICRVMSDRPVLVREYPAACDGDECFMAFAIDVSRLNPYATQIPVYEFNTIAVIYMDRCLDYLYERETAEEILKAFKGQLTEGAF